MSRQKEFEELNYSTRDGKGAERESQNARSRRHRAYPSRLEGYATSNVEVLCGTESHRKSQHSLLSRIPQIMGRVDFRIESFGRTTCDVHDGLEADVSLGNLDQRCGQIGGASARVPAKNQPRERSGANSTTMIRFLHSFSAGGNLWDDV